MMNQRLQLGLLAVGAVMLMFRFNTNNNNLAPGSFSSSPSILLLRSTDRTVGGFRQLTSSSIPEKIGAIHVGKCGGVGLRQSLAHRQTKTILKPNRMDWTHMDRVSNPYKYKNWIVLIRDPVARVQSNYIFEHVANAHLRTDAEAAVAASRLPNKAKLYECYNTLEKLVLIGLAPNAPPPDRIADHGIPGKSAEPGSDDCRRLAFGMFDGPAQHVVPGMPHFAYNYEFYTKELLVAQKKDPAMKIWLVRQEHMQDDVDMIDRALGGDGVVWHMEQFEHVNVDAAKHALEESPERKQQMSKHMSAVGLRNLCRVLCQEIQVYKTLIEQSEQNIIKAAVNDNSFMEETLAPLKQQCPEEVQSSTCEDAVPATLRALNLAESRKRTMTRLQSSETKATN